MSTSPFFQDGPVLGNQFLADRLLRNYLRRQMPSDVLADVAPDLERFGARVVGEVLEWAADATAHQPRLTPYDPWGRRIDRIDVSRGWLELERISAEEGLVAIGYERRHGAWSRVHQFAKLYLFNPSSAVYTCPLAMADGAARSIEVHGDEWLRRGPYVRLTSRDPGVFWTSGQWMTERTGGSDVGGTSTIARRDDAGYRLWGTKWFTSATTSQMAMTLARMEDAQGRTTPGSRGLSLFYLETRRGDGSLNAIEIHRLKDKLGTRALPTAELSLLGTPARLVGEAGSGVRNIATLMNITRLYNTVCAVSLMRRGVALARDYARRRQAFGRSLAEHPLHLETLADLETSFEAAFHLGFHAITLLGRDECGLASPDESAMLRLLTPLAKLFTAKLSVAAMSETLESFGGAGYVEDTGLPQLLRDAQVLTIWEGTTNVLSLDALRAIEREQALAPLLADLERRLAGVNHPELAGEAARVGDAVNRLADYLPRALAEGIEAVQCGARGFALALAGVCAAALMLEHAQWELETDHDGRSLAAARRWCAGPLLRLVFADEAHRRESRALALDDALQQPAPRSVAAVRG